MDRISKKRKLILLSLLFFLIYSLITIALFNFRFSTLFTHYGMPDVDTDGTLWYYWARIFSEERNINFVHTNSLFAYPYGVNLAGIPYFSLLYEFHIFLIKLLGSSWKAIIAVANISTLSTYALGSISMFFLGYYLTKDYLASFVGGLLFGFSFYHNFMIGGSLSLNHIWLIPLYFLSLHYFIDRKKAFYMYVSILVFLLLFSINAYWAFFCGIFSVPVLFFNLKSPNRDWMKLFMKYYILLFISLFLTNIDYIFSQLYNFNHSSITSIKSVNMQSELLNPSVYFSPDSRGLLYEWGNNAAIFTGFLPLFLMVLGLINKKMKRYFYIYLGLFLLSIMLSSNIPFFPLNELYFRVFSMFRAVSRINILGTLFLGVLAASVLAEYKAKTRYLRIVIVVFLSFIILMENYNVFKTNIKITDFTEIQKIYAPLREDKEIDVIVGYPLNTKKSSPENYMLIGQIVHEKAMVNGMELNDISAQQFANRISRIEEQDTIDALIEAGVGGIIIYNNFYPNSEHVVAQLNRDDRLVHVGHFKSDWDNSSYVSTNELSRDISIFKIQEGNPVAGHAVNLNHIDGSYNRVSSQIFSFNADAYGENPSVVIGEPCTEEWVLFYSSNFWRNLFSYTFGDYTAGECSEDGLSQTFYMSNFQDSFDIVYKPLFLEKISSFIRNIVLCAYAFLLLSNFSSKNNL